MNTQFAFFFQYCKTIATQKNQKQPPRGALSKKCSENMQHIYRRTHMAQCDFDKAALQ